MRSGCDLRCRYSWGNVSFSPRPGRDIACEGESYSDFAERFLRHRNHARAADFIADRSHPQEEKAARQAGGPVMQRMTRLICTDVIPTVLPTPSRSYPASSPKLAVANDRTGLGTTTELSRRQSVSLSEDRRLFSGGASCRIK
jgi:hypothetical protein